MPVFPFPPRKFFPTSIRKEGMWDDCVFFGMPDFGEIAHGFTPVQRIGSAYTIQSSLDRGNQSTTSSGADAAYWALGSGHPLYTLTNHCTVLTLASPTTLDSFAALFCVPYRASGWTTPFAAMAFRRNSTTSSGQLSWSYNSSSSRTVTSTTGFIQTTDGPTWYGVRRINGAVRFYRDGKPYGTDGAETDSAWDWGDKQPAAVQSRSTTSTGQGWAGFAGLTLVFRRGLTDREVLDVVGDPYAAAVDEPIQIYWPSAGGGPTYTLTADGATFTLAGQATGLKAARKMVAASSTFALTGQDVALKAARKLVAGNGAFTLTGTAAVLKAARKLSAENGAFALSGQDVTLTYSGAASPTYTLAAGSGAFVVTGGAVNLTAQRLLSAAGGIFVLTGQSVDLIYSGAESVSAAASDVEVGEQRRAFNAAAQSRRLNITRQSRRLNVRRG